MRDALNMRRHLLCAERYDDIGALEWYGIESLRPMSADIDPDFTHCLGG